MGRLRTTDKLAVYLMTVTRSDYDVNRRRAFVFGNPSSRNRLTSISDQDDRSSFLSILFYLFYLQGRNLAEFLRL